MKMMEMYFLQGTVIRKDHCYNTTTLHDALQQQGEGEGEAKIRHSTLVTEPVKNQEFQELHSCHLLNRFFFSQNLFSLANKEELETWTRGH